MVNRAWRRRIGAFRKRIAELRERLARIDARIREEWRKRVRDAVRRYADLSRENGM